MNCPAGLNCRTAGAGMQHSACGGVERRGLLAVGDARLAVEHPHVVVRVHGHAADHAGDPLVRQRLRPERIGPERWRRSGGRSEKGGHSQRCDQGACCLGHGGLLSAGLLSHKLRATANVRMLAGLARLRRSKIRDNVRSRPMKMRSAVPVLIVVLLAGFWVHAQVRDYRPVTEAMLRNPAAGDWLNWRRTDNAWGYSPLDQINRQNAGQLAARVVVGHGRHRRAGSDAARSRRHHVPAEPARRHPGPRRRHRRFDLGISSGGRAVPCPAARRPSRRRRTDRHPAPRPAARGRHGRRRRRHGTRHPAELGNFRRSNLRNDRRRARHRSRGANGESGLGHRGRGFEAGVRLHVRPDRRPRKSDRGDRRMQPLQGGRLLHHRTRRGHREGVVAHVHHCQAGRARRRDLGRPAAQVPGRQRRRGSPAATMPMRTWSTGARRRRSRGRGPFAAPTGPPFTRTRRSRSIPTPGR